MTDRNAVAVGLLVATLDDPTTGDVGARRAPRRGGPGGSRRSPLGLRPRPCAASTGAGGAPDRPRRPRGWPSRRAEFPGPCELRWPKQAADRGALSETFAPYPAARQGTRVQTRVKEVS